MTGPLDRVRLHYIESFDDVREYVDWFSNMNADAPIAVDTESTGFKWHGDDYVRMVQVGDEVDGWAMRWDRFSGLFEATVALHDGPIDLMNAKFDYAFLRKAGIKLRQELIRDVGIMSYVLEPHMSRALKNQAKRHVDPRAGALQWQLDEALGSRSGWSWATIPHDFPLYWQYAAMDPVLTALIREHHWPIVQERSPQAYEIENSFQWVALKAETYGVCIDVPYAEENYAKFTAYCDDVERWCESEYGIKPGSNQAVVRKLIELGFSEDHYFSTRTEKGAIALNSDVLEAMAGHPLADAVLQRRQLQKIASTYLRFYVGHVDADSLIHPSINTVGALTGRMSVSEPNLQNLPVRGTNPAHKVVRNCVVARPGHTLIMVDFDQIEMRGLAIDSGDAGLIEAFLSDEDFFVAVARQVYDDPTLVKSDPRRQPVKNGMYARVYGAGLAKQAATAGVSVDQMRYVNTSLNAKFPGIEPYARNIIDEGIRNGRAENSVAFTTCPLTGQRHYAERGKEYALVNYRIQGWGAKLLKLKALELDAAGLGDYIIAFVHDEIIFDVPTEMVRDAIHTIQKIMNDTTMFPVPISASVSTGQRWGDKREWTDD